MYFSKILIPLLLAGTNTFQNFGPKPTLSTSSKANDSIPIHREYTLEATMLGFFQKDGTRTTFALDMKRALGMAEKARLPKIMTYTIQRIGAIGTDESKSVLKQLNDKIERIEHSNENHENMMLIRKILAK